MNRETNFLLSRNLLLSCQEIEKYHLYPSFTLGINRPWLKGKILLLRADIQVFISYLKIFPIFVQKKSCAHICDSRAVGFAYLCSRIA